MAFRNFPGWSQANLETKLAELDEALMDGMASGSSGDSSGTNRTPEEIEAIRQKVLADLRVLDSATYGSSAPVKRTKVNLI